VAMTDLSAPSRVPGSELPRLIRMHASRARLQRWSSACSVAAATLFPATAFGFASDLLVRAGATVMFSENTEVRDGIAQLTARAANAEVAHASIAELGWHDRYLGRTRRPQRRTDCHRPGLCQW
jgi:D-galactarate dehydratase/altronate hydrolase